MNKMVVFAKAADGRTEELARWYDEQHMKDLLRVPGIVSAERHSFFPAKVPAGNPAWDFMLIYEIDGDPMTILAATAPLMGTDRMPMSDALESASTLSIIGSSITRQTSAN